MSAHGCALENSFAPIGALNLRHSFTVGAVMSIKERADADERSFKLVRTPEAILFSWVNALRMREAPIAPTEHCATWREHEHR